MVQFSSVNSTFDFPLRVSCILTQGYGMTDYALKGAYGGAIHNGIDLAGFPAGTPVFAIGPGTVMAKGSTPSAWGYWLIIRQDNGYYSLFGHFAEPALVEVGERVNSNTVIGSAGNTGESTGVHLHLSLYDADPGSNQQGPACYHTGIDPLDHLATPFDLAMI
jgi:murein DD-endopeptidase MepM/ murein hydrolase activator NlpD